jgi:hypothetical protein
MTISKEFLQELTLPQLDVVAYFTIGSRFFCDKEYAINILVGKEIESWRVSIMDEMLFEAKERTKQTER